MSCYYSSSRARTTETAAKNAEQKADKALREIGEMRGMLTEAFGKLMDRLDTLEEAIVNPKSEAAEKLAKKYGGGKGRSTALKQVAKPGGGS